MPAKRKPNTVPETATVESPLMGRDEMNLADHPLSVLTDRAHKATKTLIFHNVHGTLTITSSDAYGLPTAQDADVMVALIQLTKQKTDFAESTVNFTRYELLRLLGWPNEGKSYRRLTESLKRWHGVSLIYDGCWWDNRAKRWADANIHIIESVVIVEGSAKGTDDDSQQSLPLSSFEWNRKFIESCQAGNLKHLDLTLYFSLEHPSSKRLYRFLDKRFYRQPEWVFDLTEIAFERVGLSRNYADAGKLKEKLQPAIEELEAKRFILPMSRDERYFKEGKVWRIRFVQMPPAPAEPAPSVPPPAEAPSLPLIAEMVRRGVTAKVATDLAERHTADHIQAKLDVFDWMTEKRDKRLAKSPAGYLVKSITDDYAVPEGFISKAERQAREEAKQARERKAAEERRREKEEAARERAEQQAVAAYWSSLTPEQQKELDAVSIAQADPDMLAQENGPIKDIYQRIRRDQYIRQLLRDQQLQAAQA